MSEAEFTPWEQLPDESGEAWLAFVAHRDLGPSRNFSETARVSGVSKNSCTKWSKLNLWEARTKAWDAEVDRIRRQKFLSEQRRIIKVHAAAAEAIRLKAMEAVDMISSEFLSMDPDKALRWIKFATELEAKAVGLPTEVTALALSGGQAKPAEDVYFDSLPDEKLLDIVSMSIDVLRKEKGSSNSDDGKERGADSGEDRAATGEEVGASV